MNYRSLLSKHRSAIMGLMAFTILLFHSQLPIPVTLYRFTVNQLGDIGVDVFIFLSGFGLANALEKSAGFGDYMGRRLARILPSYYVLLISTILFHLFTTPITGRMLLIRLIPIGEWLNISFPLWYVSTILGYYVLAALFYPLMHRSKYLYLTTALLLILTNWYIPYISQMDASAGAIVRIPGLVIGLATGCASRRIEPRYRKNLPGLVCFVLLFLYGVFMVACGPYLQSKLFPRIGMSEYKHLITPLFAPLLTVLIACVFEGCEYAKLSFVNRFFGWMGKYSLEFYLAHMAVLKITSTRFSSPYIRVLVTFILSCVLSVGFYWLGKRLYKLWMRLIRRLSLTN